MVQSERPQVKLEEEKRERFDSFFINKLWTQSIKKKVNFLSWELI